MLLLLCTAGWAAEPATWRLGAGVAATGDLAAQDPLEPTRFGPGAALILAARWAPRPGAALRVHLDIGAAPGHDTVVWTESVGESRVDYFSADHAATCGAARLLVGPEVEVLPNRKISPYLGVGAGAGVVRTWNRFANDAVAPGVLAATTTQMVAAAGADVGVRLGGRGAVAIELELGYTVSFLPAASLQEAPADLDASRSAYALDVVRAGLGVSIPL